MVLGVDGDLDAAERWVDDWHAGIADRAARAASLAQRLAQLSATARSRDGLVEVTVGPTGGLLGLRLDDKVCQHSATWIAEQILVTVRRAQDELLQQVSDAPTQTVGANSATGNAIIASLRKHLTPVGTGDADVDW